MFAAFGWLSPQVHYGYYRTILPGQAGQAVTGAPPSPAALARILTFAEAATPSRHGQGLLGWSLLLLSWRSPGSGRRP
ncbi:MAG: hypothetical protein WBA25_18745 [Jannaschia sp.]